MNNYQEYTTKIFLNDEQATSKIDALNKKIDEYKAKKQQALDYGDDKGWKRAERGIKSCEMEIKNLSNTSQQVDRVLGNLSTASFKDLKRTISAINKELTNGSIKRGSEEWKVMNEQLKKCKSELQSIKDESKEVQGSKWSRFTSFFNTNFGAITQGLAALSGLSFTIRKCTSAFAQMDDVMTNVTKYTGQTKTEVEEMNEDFKRMDTRTSREQLNDLAGVAGRLGITGKQAIEDFVKGADTIGVALGDDLGEGAVDKIGKLAQMFGEDKKKGLQGAMLATGSAVNDLAQSSSANAGYIVDFTAELSGVGIQAKMTQAQIMGLASALDQNSQEEATSATVFSQLITKMYQEPARFAKIAGMQVKEFSDLMKNDANAGIIKFLEAMKSKGGFDAMAPLFNEMKLDGSRAVGVLSSVASHIDQVKEAQKVATESYAKGTSVVDEYNKQNSSVQAQLDKAKKRFSDLSIALGQKLMPIARYSISTISLSVKALAELINFLSQYKTTLITVAASIAILSANRLIDIAITKLQILVNNNLAKGIKALYVIIMRNPWTAAAVAIAAVTAVVIDLVKKTKETEKELNKIREDAAEKVGEENERIRQLLVTAKDEHKSLQDRQEAIKQLNKIIPNYNAQLDKTTNKYIDNKIALDDYLKSLQRKYELEGAKSVLISISSKIAKANMEIDRINSKLPDAQEKENQLAASTGGVYGKTSADELRENLKEQNDIIKDAGEQRSSLYKLYPELNGLGDTKQLIVYNPHDHDKYKKTNKNGSGVNNSVSAHGGSGGGNGGSGSDTRLTQAKKDDKAIQDELQNHLLQLTLLYRRGEINYDEYNSATEDAQLRSIAKRKSLYRKSDEEYKKLSNDQQQMYLDNADKEAKRMDDEIERARVTREAYLKAQFIDPTNTDLYQNQAALDEALFRNEMDSLHDRIKVYGDEYGKGSKEVSDLQAQYDQKQADHKLKLQQSYLDLMNDAEVNANKHTSADLKQQQLSYWSQLKEKGLITAEQFEQIRLALERKYNKKIHDEAIEAAEKRKQDVDKMVQDAAGISDKDKDTDGMVGGFWEIGSAIGQYSKMYDAIDKLRKTDQISEQEAADEKAAIYDELWKKIAKGAQAAFEGIDQILSASSAYSQACSDYEVAKITKNYDKQIEAAGNNSKKKERLEKKRDEEIRKVKTAANKKAMNIELAQAFSSAALAAINAYASGAKVNVWLGPIAAAAALAAGAIQIATIKKQHETEALGYYSGGFTNGKEYHKPAGIVHQGEFIADHVAVNNRNILPALQLIDYAQKNNTVGQLTGADISRSVGGGSATVVAPIVNVQTNNDTLNATINNLNIALLTLNAQLSQGITAIAAIDGPNGVKKQLDNYNKLLSNK
jgi:TP901 family phage tail tape measure protein